MGLAYPLSCGNLNTFYLYLMSSILDFVTLLEVRIKRFVYENIKRCYEIQCYKGLRHKDSLPVRGQRTRTNASTKKNIKYNLKPIITKVSSKKSKV
jgi:small subunit ribosomal protein S13